MNYKNVYKWQALACWNRNKVYTRARLGKGHELLATWSGKEGQIPLQLQRVIKMDKGTPRKCHAMSGIQMLGIRIPDCLNHLLMLQDSEVGIIPRALNDIFDNLRIGETVESFVRVSFVELYNEEIFDLLSGYNDQTRLR